MPTIQNTQIVITNSPMINGDEAVVLEDCLKKVKEAFLVDQTHKPILIFKFNSMIPHGCVGHPDIAEHQLMANEYAPFLKKLLQ